MDRTAPSDSLDCELYLTGRDQARLRVAEHDYSGRPALDEDLEHRLRKASLDPIEYGTLLFDGLFPAADDLLAGYRAGLVIARREARRLRLRLHIASTAPADLHRLHWERLYDSREKLALGSSRDVALSRYLSVGAGPGTAVAGSPRLLVVLAGPTDLAEFGQGQRYASEGAVLGTQFQINSSTGAFQNFPSVAADADGDFVVVWTSDESSGSDNDDDSIQGQRYASDGTAVGEEFQINSYTTNGQRKPAVAASNDDFVVVWESEGSSGTDNSWYSIQGQRFEVRFIFADGFESGDTSAWSNTVQ